MATALLAGKNAVVTGASMGIGRAVALQLAREGANVVVNSRADGDPQPLQEVADAITRLGRGTIACRGSVTDYGLAGRLIDTCVETFGSIDILVNIAGIGEGYGHTVADLPPERWREVLDVHLTGSFNTCQHAARHMVAQGGGAIINTGSHAWLGIYGGSAYAAAKGGINSLSAAIARDLGASGLRCNVIHPGARTRLSSGDDYNAHIHDLAARGLLPAERVQSALDPAPPEHIAALYAWLASDRARHINGELLAISGRHLARFPWPQEQVYALQDAVQAWDVEEIERQLGTR